MERCPILNNNFRIATLDEIPLQTVLPDFTEETLEAADKLRCHPETFEPEGFWLLSQVDKCVPMIWVRVREKLFGLDTRDHLGKIVIENYLKRTLTPVPNPQVLAA